MNRIFLVFCALIAALASFGARAADDDNLLPVDQAFKLEAKAIDRDHVELNWKVADTYYLYRNRIKITSADDAVKLGTLDLPTGDKHHDEFFGDVEVYHHPFTATQPLTAPADRTQVTLTVKYQGCHQVDPKICFPPQTKKIDITLPAAAASNDSGIKLGATSNGLVLGNHLPLPAEQAFVFEAIATGPAEVLARFTMPKGYYLYRDKTHFSATDATLAAPRWPNGENHTDENFGTTTVYFNQIEVPIGVSGNKTPSLALTAEFQGCQDHGVCYPVMTRTVNVALSGSNTPSTTVATSTTAADSADDAGGFKKAFRGSLWLGLLSFFVFGLGLAFTPCVFPMIPILSGIIAGAGDNISTRRAILLSVIYILANAVIFTIAGVVAGLAGKNLQAAFQTPWILWSFAGLFVLLAFSMFGFYELQLPSSWQSKIANVSNRQSGGSLFGVAIMGALSALIVGPCVTPPLAAAVIYIAQEHDPVLGGAALFSLALGMGAPLIVFGASAGKLLPRAGAWMDAVKAVFGVTFIGLAIWMLSRTLDSVWVMLMAGALAVACAVYLGALDRLPDNASGWRKLWKTLGVILLIAGAAELIGAAAGSNDLLQPLRGFGGGSASGAPAAASLQFKRVKSVADVDSELAAAKAAGKPVMLDFFADWCVSCKEMEKFTFTKSEVKNAVSDFVLLQADVTANDDIDQALMKKFAIIAPPDTLFFAKDGNEKKNLQLTGTEDADKFVQRIEAVSK
jgi:thioredoxin:protein disulfide reductase